MSMPLSHAEPSSTPPAPSGAAPPPPTRPQEYSDDLPIPNIQIEPPSRPPSSASSASTDKIVDIILLAPEDAPSGAAPPPYSDDLPPAPPGSALAWIKSRFNGSASSSSFPNIEIEPPSRPPSSASSASTDKTVDTILLAPEDARTITLPQQVEPIVLPDDELPRGFIPFSFIPFIREASSSVCLVDFNGHQVPIPCQSWQDLCVSLDMACESVQESRFIGTRSFGIRIPSQMDLLSHESWDSWVSAIDEDLKGNPPNLELYAIMKDDSDRCPHCNIMHPVTKPLPDLNHQQCLACKGTFLERFEFREPSQSTEHEVVKFNGQTYIANSGASSTTAVEIMHSSVPDAPSSSAAFLPQRVQVIRRRPHSQRVPEVEQPWMDPAPPLSAVQILPISKTPNPPLIIESPWASSKLFFHIIYRVFLFGLPDRYLGNSPQPQTSLDSDGSPLAYAKACDAFYKRCSNEWREMGAGAAVLFSLLFTILQISSAAYDPVVRTVVQLSIVCLFFGSIYAFILSPVFGKLEQAAAGPVWMRNARRAPTDTLWNPWIMLSLPLSWIIWGLFYFAIFIMAFLWRSGATDEPNENSGLSKTAAYGPRIVTTLIFAAGTVYLGLVIVAARKI
ncbi:hypothetical protein B0H14DRAFT_3143210 [Mycena olivaceomarginata]|nr:hypothetical protein B0H14DRAFT_3143210 [Mycena olivaceomarginata]